LNTVLIELQCVLSLQHFHPASQFKLFGPLEPFGKALLFKNPVTLFDDGPELGQLLDIFAEQLLPNVEAPLHFNFVIFLSDVEN
jgi:hypothetical protein